MPRNNDKMEPTWKNRNYRNSRSSSSTTKRTPKSDKNSSAKRKERCRNCLNQRVMFRHGICQPCWRNASPLLRGIFKEAATRKRAEYVTRKVKLEDQIPPMPKKWWEFWRP